MSIQTIAGIALIGVLLCTEPLSLRADEKPQPEFRIEVRIIEKTPIEGVTKQDPFSLYHLRIKPALVVTPSDVEAVRKQALRGASIEDRKTGKTRRDDLLVVDISLTNEAKMRLKAAVEKTNSRKITTVLNGKHLGDWTKYITDENQDASSLVHWRQFGPRISCTGDKDKAERLVKFLTGAQGRRHGP